MSSQSSSTPPCGTKRTAVEAFETDQSSFGDAAALHAKDAESSYCDSCTDPQFLKMVTSGTPDRISRDLEDIWQNQTCPCCRLFRQVLLQKYEPDWIRNPHNGRSLLCRFQIRYRDPEDHLQRTRLLKSMDIVQMDISRGGDIVYSYAKLRKPEKRCAGRLETTSSHNLRIGNTVSKYVMIRRPMELNLDYDMLKSWINECQSDHAKLRSPLQNDLIEVVNQGRFRLIDVESKEVIRIYEIKSYCALSYVWSDSMTTSSRPNSDEAATSVPCPQRKLSREWDEIPKTIRHAIDVIRNIGHRYLWVDYFCIDQCDPQDKAENIARMSSIYRSAELTLIVADGTDADSGLTRARPSHVAEIPDLLPNKYGRDSIALLPARPSLEDVVRQSTWDTRAWTFQERVLSSRCLVFTPDEVYFDCSHRIFREAYKLVKNPACQVDASAYRGANRTHNGKPRTLHGKALLRKALSPADYFKFVSAYTQRALTYPGDRLDAFNAVLRKFEGTETSPDQRYAESGIPLAFMAIGMLWIVPVREGLVRSSTQIPTDSRGSRKFPTWSWIAWSGRIVKAMNFLLSLSIPAPDSPSRLDFILMDKYNIVARPSSKMSEWPLWLDDTPALCRPEPGGPVTLHIMAKIMDVRIRIATLRHDVGPYTQGQIVEVDMYEPRSREVIGQVPIHAHHIYEQDHGSGLAILLWLYDSKQYNGTFYITMLLRKVDDTNVYERVSLDFDILHNASQSAFDAHCRTKYIRLR